MYSGSSADIRLIDINRPSNIVVLMRNDESSERDNNGFYRRMFGYTNNGYRITFLYNEDFTNEKILHHERMNESEIEAIKQEYEEIGRRTAEIYGQDAANSFSDDRATRYNFDD